jgi:hypothetical protein
LAPADWLPWRWIAAVAIVATVLFVAIWLSSGSIDESAPSPAVAADPPPDESALQDELPADAFQASTDAPPAAESTVTTPTAALAPDTADPANATSPPSDAVARPARTATVNRARIEADTASISISEGAPSAVVVLRRSGNAAVPLTVTWQLQDGSAREGEDYTTPANRGARFAAGQTTRAIYVPLVNDDQPEPEESLSLTFESPRATIDSGSVTITILDDD